MKTKSPKKPVRKGRPIMVWLDTREQEMLSRLMEVDTRNQSDTVRYSIRTTYAERFPAPPQAQ